VKFIIWKDNFVVFTVEGFNSDEFKLGGLHHKHVLANFEVENNLIIFLKTRGNKETFIEMADRRTFRMHTDL
jgi:hypothetical protein